MPKAPDYLMKCLKEIWYLEYDDCKLSIMMSNGYREDGFLLLYFSRMLFQVFSTSVKSCESDYKYLLVPECHEHY